MKIDFTPDTVRLIFSGMEQVWAFKSEVKVLREHIKQVEYEPSFKEWRTWGLRLPGTALPGKLIAGSYWTNAGWDFLYVLNPKGWLHPTVEQVMVIETDQNYYRRIIFTCPQADADRMLAWWLGAPATTGR